MYILNMGVVTFTYLLQSQDLLFVFIPNVDIDMLFDILLT